MSRTSVAHVLLPATWTSQRLKGAISHAKIKYSHLIQIELRGKHAKISQNEYELSADEWHRRQN